jgi:acetyl-CoA C-acetyltransferase
MLAGLKTAFNGAGTVTAGNSSGINDGAAVVVVTTQSYAREHGPRAMVSLEAMTTAAMEPDLVGYTPVLTLKTLFEQTGLSPSDIDITEVNEAFAAQAVAVIRDAKLDPEKTNRYGGAIALGHPVGATGANLSLRVAKHLVRQDAEFGIVAMCIGGGQALAALLRRV